MRVKCPDEISAGDQVWQWSTYGWATVTAIISRRNETAMVRLDHDQSIEIFVKRLVR